MPESGSSPKNHSPYGPTMITAAAEPVTPIVPFPRAPRTLEEAGLPFDLIVPLILKTLHFSGERTGAALATRLGVQYSVIEPALNHLKTAYLVEIAGGGLTGGPGFVYRPTADGTSRGLRV